MKRFEFDAYDVLHRVRAEMEAGKCKNAGEPLLTANPANFANRRGDTGEGLAGLAGLAISSTPQEKITDAIDHFEERAAIREYDGCQPRSEAEAAALIEAARAAGVEVIDLRAAIAAGRKGTA